MARKPKINPAEIAEMKSLADEHMSLVHYLARIGREKGFSETPTLESTVALLTFGNALTDLAQVMLFHAHLAEKARVDDERMLRAIADACGET